jgi:hypothetical protein
MNNADQMLYRDTLFALGYLEKGNVFTFVTPEHGLSKRQDQALTFASWREAVEYRDSLVKGNHPNAKGYEAVRLSMRVPFGKRTDLKKSIELCVSDARARETSCLDEIEAIKNKETISPKDLKRGFKVARKLERVQKYLQFLEDLQKGK